LEEFTHHEHLRNSKPWVIALICVVLGFGLGLLWGWVVSPVQWTDATPEYLRHDIQQDYLTMTIDSYTVNHDAALAQQRYAWLGAEAPTILAEIAPSIDPTIYAEFTQVVAATPVAPPPEETGGDRSLFMTLLIVLAVVVILGESLSALLPVAVRKSGPEILAQEAEYSRSVAKTDSPQPAGSSGLQFVTTYVLGDDLFDDSFSIDSSAGEFLGECGVGISETQGVEPEEGLGQSLDVRQERHPDRDPGVDDPACLRRSSRARKAGIKG
jgi:hypothetical protein